jgi:hypothetical protein
MATQKAHREYTIKFHHKYGCEMGIVREMARYDSSEVVSVEATPVNSEGTEPNARSVVLRTLYPVDRWWKPTMDRWASFWVGAVLVEADAS